MGSRTYRFLPLVAVVALVASVFAPLYSFPVLADQATPVSGPELTQPEPDGGGDTTGPEDTSVDDPDIDDSPAVVDPVLVVPERPVVTDATCNEGVLYTQTVATAEGPEGITYDLQIDDDGVVTVTASLEEGSAWDTANISTNWQLSADGLVYVHTFTLEPCAVDTTEARTRGEGSALGTFNNASSTGLSISKIDNRNGPVVPLELRTYTITVTGGGGNIFGYSFVDTLPQGVEYISSTVPNTKFDSCTQGPVGTIACSVPPDQPTLPIETWTITVRVKEDISADACENGLVNTVGKGSYGTWSENNSASVTTRISQDYCVDLSLSKAPVASTVGPYDDVQFKITVNNDGIGAATGVTVTDTLPPGLAGYSWSVDNGCTVASLTVKCTDLTVPGEDEVVITVTGEPDDSMYPPTSCGTHTNSAVFTFEGTTSEPVPADVTVVCAPLLTMTKIAEPAVVEPGGLINYTITVENIGTATQPEYGFWDSFPAGTALAASPAPTLPDSSTCFPAVIAFDCIGGELPAGSTHVYTFSLLAGTSVTATMCDVGITNLAGGTSVGEWKAESIYPQVTAHVDLECNPAHEFWKTAVAPVVVPGDDLHYVISLENTGNIPIDEATITDNLASLPGDAEWTITPSAGVACEPIVGDGTLTCHLTDDLAPNANVTVDIAAQIPEDLEIPESEWCGTWENTTSVAGEYDIEVKKQPSVSNADRNASPDYSFENTSSASVYVNCTGPKIEKSASSPSIEPGGQVVYTVKVTNYGATDVSPLIIYDPLVHADAVFTDWSITSENDPEECIVDINPVPGSGTEDELGYGVACGFLVLPTGESVTVIITATAPEFPTWEQCARVENRAAFLYLQSGPPTEQPTLTSLASPEPGDLVYSNTVTTQVDCDPQIEIEKVGTLNTGDDDLMQAGDLIEYTFTISNTGNVDLEDIVLDDPMPGLEWSDNREIDVLKVDSSVVLTASYKITQADIDEGMIVNCADVTATGPGEAVVAHEDCDTRLIDQDIAIQVIQACPGPADEFAPGVGEEVTYEMTITNTGSVTVNNVEVATSREGTFDQPLPTTFAPGESVTREWTIMATQADYDAREIVVEITVTGETEAGASAMLASMVAMQVVSDSVESTLLLTCPMNDLPEPEAPVKVTKLPETGIGSVSAGSMLLGAAMVSMILLGAGGMGVLRKGRR